MGDKMADQQPHQDKETPRRPKTLIGIISSAGAAYRGRHHELFQIWNDTCVRPLWEYQVQQSKSCELIYTFVLGANQEPDGRTEIVDDSVPLYKKKPIKTYNEDVNDKDTMLLNIRYVVW